MGVDGLMPDELFSLSEVTRKYQRSPCNNAFLMCFFSSRLSCCSRHILLLGIIFDGSKDNSDLRRIRGSIPRAIKNAKNLTYLDM